jgi:hypothetical protein
VTETLVRVGRGPVDKQLNRRGVDNVAMKTLILSVLFAACGTKTNPDACCTDAADCATKGLPDGSMCTGGLICRGNTCIAEDCTTSADCEAGAPFCPSSGLCAATCDTDAECPGFGGNAADKFCTTMGTCVACRDDADCDGATPLCDTSVGQCHGCVLDTDCASGACGSTGACVDEADLIYVDGTNGTDAGQCTKSAPCKTVQFGIDTAVLARSQLVLTPTMYVENLTVNTTFTSASTVTIHGHGATLRSLNGNDGPTISAGNVGVVIEDTNFIGNGTNGGPIQSGISPVEMHRVTVSNDGPIIAGTNMTLSDLDIADGNEGILLGGSHLSADRIHIHGGFRGIRSSSGSSTVAITNLLIHDMSDVGLDMTMVVGSIQFATVADNVGGGIIGCSSSLSLQSSIVWTPANTPVIGACVVSGTIAGPSGTVGMQTDPKFVDETHRDYHLQSTSTMVDSVDAGPATDVEGTKRPQGVRFDGGAYEYKP